MIIWKHDKVTGIECGVNDDDDLFIGNDESGATLPDTPTNRAKILREFDRYTTKEFEVC